MVGHYSPVSSLSDFFDYPAVQVVPAFSPSASPTVCLPYSKHDFKSLAWAESSLLSSIISQLFILLELHSAQSGPLSVSWMSQSLFCTPSSFGCLECSSSEPYLNSHSFLKPFLFKIALPLRCFPWALWIFPSPTTHLLLPTHQPVNFSSRTPPFPFTEFNVISSDAFLAENIGLMFIWPLNRIPHEGRSQVQFVPPTHILA